MPTELKMPALSPTMEEGTLAKWLVSEGDTVKSGDLLAEIETDKAVMEFEAVDEGVIGRILVAEGTEGVKVGTVIATLEGEGEGENRGEGKQPSPAAATGKEKAARASDRPEAAPAPAPTPAKAEATSSAAPPASAATTASPQSFPARGEGERIKASPLARRIAAVEGIDLATLKGSGPAGRIVRADLGEAARPVQGAAVESPSAQSPVAASDIPHETVKLSSMRKTIARRLTESKSQVPHIYLTVDVRLDALLKLRGDLNAGLAGRGIKLSVNDLLIKALALALIEVPECNVAFAGDRLIKYARADISVAVSIPGGLITPIIVGASDKSLSTISREIGELAGRAREGKLEPHEYQGGTASLSNMGMYGIKQFDAIINPPQGMILAVGAGEKRPYVVDDSLQIASVMSATGSFDHRAIDGTDGAKLMKAFKALCEAPLGMLA